MQVIGVAEPDNHDAEKKFEESMQELDQYEMGIGNTLYGIGMFTSVSAGWVLKAMKYRNLLYKRYHHVPLVDFWGFERSQRPLIVNIGAGFPALALDYYLQLRPPFRERLGRRWYPWYRVISRWVRLHLTVYATLQQVDLYPAHHILPDWRFFIPFSSMSPIPAPPPPTAFTTAEIFKWLGKAAINATPLLVIAVCDWARIQLTVHMFFQVFRRLPFPRNRKRPSERPSAPRAATVPPAPEELPQRSAQAPVPAPQPEPTPQPVEGDYVIEPPVNPRTVRRQSTLSTSNGATTATTSEAATAVDLYPSDDEEYTGREMISRTLISFDVEAPDTVDPAPGIWSAELRANSDQHPSSNPGRSSVTTPTYRVNALTELPARLATIIMAAAPVRIITAPIEGVTLRWLVQLILESRGMSTEGIYVPFDPLPCGAVANFVGLELVHFLVQAEIWAAMYQIASWCRISEEDWKLMDEEEEAEMRRDNEASRLR
jgi:hypothetical protein